MKSCSVLVLLSVVYVSSGSSSWRHLQKRQDECPLAVLATSVCTNGYYEDYAYLAAQCNQPDIARSISDNCRFNENGVVCASFDTLNDLTQFTSACGSSLNDSCSDECRSFLADNRARYGCCVTIFNDTRTLSADEAVAFSYPLWSRCGVEPVTEECAPSSFNMPAEIDPTCVGQDLTERLTFHVLCRTEYLDGLRELTESCGLNGEDPVHCAADANGNYCSLQNEISSADFTATTNCLDTSVCDPVCIETLTSFTNTYGCCFISVLNDTTTSGGPRSYLSYDFWEMCGLTSPGFCGFKFDNSPSRVSTAVVVETSVFAVLLATMISLALMK